MVNRRQLRLVAAVSTVVAALAGCTGSGTSLGDPRAELPTISAPPPPVASGPAPTASSSRTVSTPPAPPSTTSIAPSSPSVPPKQVRFVDWIRALGPLGGASDAKDDTSSLLVLGECAEARTRARDIPGPLSVLYAAAAAACLAAFSGRSELWSTAESAVNRRIPLQDCFDRAVADILSALVEAHRRYPDDVLRREPAADRPAFPCPRITELDPAHGPSQGGYTIRVRGQSLPPVVRVHFMQSVGDITVSARSSDGTTAVVPVPRRLPGADREVQVYPEGWPTAPLNTQTFTYDEPVGATSPTASPTP